MHAIMNGGKGTSSRGDRVPKSVASKYSGGDGGKGLPESKGKEQEGGVWGEKHHKTAKDKKKKKSIKKSFENYYFGRGAGTVVVDDKSRILIGKRSDDKLWTTPGGHVETDETYEDGALRELKEEANITGYSPQMVHEGKFGGNECQQFVVTEFKGKIKSNGELTSLKWCHPDDLPMDKMRWEAIAGIKSYLTSKMRKSLRDMLGIEALEKNIIRGGGVGGAGGNSVGFDMTHGDSLRLVGNGTFRFLRNTTKGMNPEDFKDVKIDTSTLSIRKHMNDVYSGRITDGHKVIHQFINRSLPQLAAELMSVFEWYMPEDEPHLDSILDDGIPDDAIHGGFNELIDKYKKHNIANIYDEMENIREEVRHGMAVDLQQIEIKIMKLFEKLEGAVHEVGSKHNVLTAQSGNEIDELEAKIFQLQSKIEELGKKPVTVEAYSSNPVRPANLLSNDYCYFTKPVIEISPNGKIKIVFANDWNHMDQENFLQDMRAKTIKKSRG